MKIMNEVSFLGAHDDESTRVTLDDPELFKYPIAYIIEVGWWTVTDREAAGLRAYLQKGGFLFVDDFKPAGWRGVPAADGSRSRTTMRRVLPDVQFLRHGRRRDPIFHSFFEINDLDTSRRPTSAATRSSRVSSRTTIRDKRLMAIVNYNTDVSQFWEWSGRGFRPFDRPTRRTSSA